MIIRATKKLLNKSRIEPLKYLDESEAPFPGKWYAGLVSTGSQRRCCFQIYSFFKGINQYC
jgi:hypothetical protein